MAQAVGRPKAKSKNVVSVEKDVAEQDIGCANDAWMKRDREAQVWRLASDMLLQKAKLASALTPSSISEVARWAKQLDWELYG